MPAWAVAALGITLAAGGAAGGEPDSDRADRIGRIAAAIEKHIAEESAASDGSFHLLHEGRDLELKLVRVHLEYLADLGDGVQFACVDLVGSDGPVYDVDFFLRSAQGDTTVTETTVHKVNGQPLYAWEQTAEGGWVRVPITDATPRLLGVLRGEDRFEFTYRFRLPELKGPAKLWLPLAQSSAFQTVEIERIAAPSKVRTLEESAYGNKVLYLTAGREDGGKLVEIRYVVRREEASPYPTGDSSPRAYLVPERLVPSDTSFVAIAEQAVRGKATDLMRARALYDHVIDKVRYARFGSGWGQGDAVYACNVRSGNCTDFHAYFIALARAIGIPARFAIGAAIPSERDDGGIDGYHCWAEFYADGRWWPVDVSEADKNASLASYYFGHQPANRIELSRGRDLVVEPGPASGPINFLAYPVLEVEGEPTPVRPEFLFRRTSRQDDADGRGRASR